MVVDTSALLAILLDEPERRAFTEAIEAAASCSVSVATVLETTMVVQSRFGADGVEHLDQLLETAGFELVLVDAPQLRLARQAFSRYGKGRDPAGLNYGDCFAYALARSLDEPLLFKGDDFSRTDVVPAVVPPPLAGSPRAPRRTDRGRAGGLA